MSFIGTLGAWMSRPDPRPTHEVEGDIAEELEFHLAMRTQEGIELGLSPEEARAQAEARFGDVDKVRRDCRRTQIGDRIMLQRINAVAVVVLLAAVVLLGWRSYAAEIENREQVDALRADVLSLTLALRGEELPAVPVDVEIDGRSMAELVRRRVDPLGVIGAEVREEGGLVVHMPAGTEVATAATPEDWLDRFRAANGWREGLALGNEIAELDPDAALDLMRAIYHRIPSVEHRQQILKPFVFHGGHVHAVEILHLAATDPSLDVQGWAFGYLKNYAYRDFGEDYAAYQAWYDRFGGQPLADVLRGSATELCERLRSADTNGLGDVLAPIEQLDLRPGDVAGFDVAAELRRLGALEHARRGLDALDAQTRVEALRFAAALGPDEPFLRSSVLPLLESRDDDPALLSAGAEALGAAGQAWAIEPLAELAQRRLAEGGDGVVFSVGRALAELDDPRAIPHLIALIVADDDYWSSYGLGYFGLAKLTGVDYDEAHDGAWWQAWWKNNHDRLPAGVRDATLPTYSLNR